MFGHIGRLLGKVYRFRFILEYILYLSEAVLAIAVGKAAGCRKPIGACLTDEVQDARTHLIGLILIVGLLQYTADIVFHILMYGRGLLNEPLELRVQDRFVTAGFGDGALQVIRSDSVGNAAIVILRCRTVVSYSVSTSNHNLQVMYRI